MSQYAGHGRTNVFIFISAGGPAESMGGRVMLAESLQTLAQLAGLTVVAAAVTDAWETARRRTARLLGRGDPKKEQLAEQRLEETHERLTSLQGDELKEARTALAERWTTRLADLLEEDPGIEAELRALVQEIQAALPAGAVSATDHGIAAGRDVNIRADRGSFAAGSVHGDVTLPGPTSPGPATS